LNDGFQIKKEVNVMQTNIQQPQTIPAEPATAPVSANQPPVNGYAAAMHQQYLQTAQEFNKALAALSELEQTLVQTAHLNGNHHHLDTVMQRINRLFEHQETMMQMHRMMLNAPAPLPAMPVPVSTPAPVQPAVAPPVPAVSAAPAVAQPVAPVELTPTTTTRPEVSPPRPTAAPSEPAQTSSTDVEKLLLATVSDKTGYPAETLELSMNMEADLGIDSIKRVEILGAIQEEMPEIDTIDMEALGGLNTLQEVVDFIQELAAQGESKKA
ncbi:MAG: hypothetical protein JW750_07785, partial [Anaerolineaceae bacterium]|nr:hypothetical protein [Anaerolineaceae bacterium]